MALLEVSKVIKDIKKCGNGFSNAKVWKFSALQDIAKSQNLDIIEDDKLIRRIARKIRDSYISEVLNGEKEAEKSFLDFMETFLESGISNFEVSALLSSQTLNSNNPKAILQKQRAEECMRRVKAYYEKNKKK